ncbi:MAG: lysine biosynthesis protein LysX [Candidatus Bathyarchaeia archaeon]
MSKAAIGMIYDQVRPEERMIIESAKKRNVDLRLYDANDLVINITDPSKKNFEIQEDVVLQRSIGHFRGFYITALLESKGITVVNSFKVSEICGNKLLTSVALAKAGIPTPKTLVAFTSSSALKALEEIGYPATLKPIFGSWGRLVAPLKDSESARAIFEDRELMFPLYQIYYIQEMVQRPPRDIRCFVIGNRVVAAIYRYSPPGDWRTNTARGGKAEACRVTPELEELSVKAAKAVGGGILGVDLMESNEGFLVHEINSTTEFHSTVPATGVDIPGLIIDYLVKRMRR